MESCADVCMCCSFVYAVKPKFKVRPANTTAYEGYSTMLHCVAVGDPTPVVRWDKNNRVSSFDQDRFRVGLLYNHRYNSNN